MRKLVVLALLCASVSIGARPAGAASTDYARVRLNKVLPQMGGRVDWSADQNTIYYDDVRNGTVMRMNPDGSNQRCVSCDYNLPATSAGQPVSDASGRWLVVQVVKPGNYGPQTGPGAGLQNDLWVLDLWSTTTPKQAYQLTHTLDGGGRGVLHPQFSTVGTRLLWADIEYSNFVYDDPNKVYPDSRLAVADLVATPTPHLENVAYYDPLGDPTWYETAGWGPDNSWVYFTCTAPGANDNNGDVCRMDFSDPTHVTRITKTSGTNGEPGEFDEHPHLSPWGDAFVWMTSHPRSSAATEPGAVPPTDLWMMNVDGSNQRQMTFFNVAGQADNAELLPGQVAVVADNDWSPDGTHVVLYAMIETAAQQEVVTERVYVLDLTRTAPGDALTPPDTSIASGPTNTAASTSATFAVTGLDNRTLPRSLSFQCSLDASPFAACASGNTQSYSGLAAGNHTFMARAVDGDGNIDPTPVSRVWAVDPSLAPPAWANPSANAADSGGDGNGFEVDPAGAYADGGSEAADVDGPGDRHRYSGYASSIPALAVVTGIEVAVDWRTSDTTFDSSLGVELSSDGGTTWTMPQRTQIYKAPAGEKHDGLGATNDLWGRSWTVAQAQNAMVRVTSVCQQSGIDATVLCGFKDWYLDWLPIRVDWVLPPNSAGHVNGGGALSSSRSLAVDVAFTSGGGVAPTGSLSWSDGAVSLVSTGLTGLSIVGSQARLAGVGLVNGVPVAFTADIGDEPDAFAIHWPGYDAGGPLTGGNLHVRAAA